MESENLTRFAAEFLGPLPNYAAQQGFTLHALLQLNSVERAQAEEMLWQALLGGNTDTRVMMGLGELRSQRAAAVLKELLQGGQLLPHKVIQAALALWQIEQFSPALDYILKVLNQAQDYFLKVQAINALQHFAYREVEQVLRGMLHDEHAAVRSQAMRSILALYGLLTGIGWPPIVTDMMMDDPNTWQVAIAELDRLTAPLSLPPRPAQP